MALGDLASPLDLGQFATGNATSIFEFHSEELGPHTFTDTETRFDYVNLLTFLIYVFMLVVGVPGNLLVCYAVLAFKDMRNNTFHLFLA